MFCLLTLLIESKVYFFRCEFFLPASQRSCFFNVYIGARNWSVCLLIPRTPSLHGVPVTVYLFVYLVLHRVSADSYMLLPVGLPLRKVSVCSLLIGFSTLLLLCCWSVIIVDGWKISVGDFQSLPLPIPTHNPSQQIVTCRDDAAEPDINTVESSNCGQAIEPNLHGLQHTQKGIHECRKTLAFDHGILAHIQKAHIHQSKNPWYN